MSEYSALAIGGGNDTSAGPKVTTTRGVSATSVNGQVTMSGGHRAPVVQAPTNTALEAGKVSHARDSWGIVKTGADINENSVVNIRGMETTIKAAMAAGLVERNADGSYSTKGETSPQEQAPADPNADDERMDDSVETLFTEAVKKASMDDLFGVLNAASKGEATPEAAIGRIASQMGLEPGEVMQRAETIRGAFTQQAMTKIGQSGFDAQDVVNWAWENRPDLMKQAIYAHVTDRHTKGYDAVVKAYLGGLEKSDPSAILGAQLPNGFTARKAADGKIIVSTPHGEYSWASLVAMGAVSAGRK